APAPAQPVTTAPAQSVAPAPKPVATQPVKPVAPAKPAPAPTQVASAKPASKPAEKTATGGAGNSSWYAGQKPGNYVVQIFGTSSEASAQSFVKAQGGDYRYFKKNLQGKPLFVVTYGNFASRDAAAAAIKNLPAKVQAGKPWPRTVGSVQQELATAR
ncbi:SPOR domain-containing protein, partial [Pseudomonas mosselii]